MVKEAHDYNFVSFALSFFKSNTKLSVWVFFENPVEKLEPKIIHVLVSQNNAGELILGDSHEYGWDVSPFDKEEINRHILGYLSTFADFPTLELTETWHGVYPKLPGKTEFVANPAHGVWIVNGLSGAGMTMSFGLAETLV